MPKSIKDIKLDWAWDGDTESLKGFNVALCHTAQTPLTSTAAFATVIDPTKRSYIFKNQICSVGLEYQGYVQAIYETTDSDWVSTGSILTIPDDGVSTVAQRREVDYAQYTANKKTVTYSQAAEPSIVDDSYGDIWFDTDDYNRQYRCTDITAATPTFTRASTAYNSNGTLSAINVPRYEQGKFGTALLIEEGTTNILTANQSSVETDLTGISSWSIAVTRDTTEHYAGLASIKCIATDTGYAGPYINTGSGSIAPGETITASVYVKAMSSTGFPIRLGLEWKNASGGSISISYNENTTIKTGWVRIVITAVAPPLTDRANLTIYAQNASIGDTFWVDNLQVEKKAFVSKWQIGGTARSGEVFSMPAANIIDQNYGTLAAWTNISNISSVGSSTILHCGGVKIFCDNGGYKATVNGVDIISNIPKKSTLTHVAVTWNSSRACLYIDGILAGSVAPGGAPTLESDIYIGCSSPGTNKLNGTIEDVRVYKKVLGDSNVFMLYKYNQSMSDTSVLARLIGNTNVAKLGWVLSEDIRVSDMVSDSVFSPVEKQSVRTEWEGIYAEKLKFVTQATGFSLTSDAAYTAYIAKYQALANYLNGGTAWTEGTTPPAWITDASISTSTAITATAFRTAFKDFYDVRQGLLNRFDTYASTKASWGGIPDVPPRFADAVPPTGSGLIMTAAGLGYYNSGSLTSYLGSDGKFKLWGDANNSIDWGVTAAGVLTIRGKLTAGDITSGGTLTGQNISGGTITIGSGNSIFKADTNGIYLGNSTFASAPFRVSPTGALTATNAAITGAISSSTITGGSIDIGTGAFKVTSAGAVTCSNITITGGSISWGAVTKPSYSSSEVGALPAGSIAGGGNLVYNSDFSSYDLNTGIPTGFQLYNNGGYSSTLLVLDSGMPEGVNYWRMIPNAAMNSTWGFYFTYHSTTFGGWAGNTDYVVSFLARGSGAAIGKQMFMTWNTAPTTSATLMNPPLSSGWQKYAFYLNWGNGAIDPNGFFSIAGAMNAGDILDVMCVQVEKGTFPSGYTKRINGTYIGQNGIYTGTLVADKVQTGSLKSSNYVAGSTGSIINLDAGTMNIGSKFSVNSDGTMSCSGATIRGTLHADDIMATNFKINSININTAQIDTLHVKSNAIATSFADIDTDLNLIADPNYAGRWVYYSAVAPSYYAYNNFKLLVSPLTFGQGSQVRAGSFAIPSFNNETNIKLHINANIKIDATYASDSALRVGLAVKGARYNNTTGPLFGSITNLTTGPYIETFNNANFTTGTTSFTWNKVAYKVVPGYETPIYNGFYYPVMRPGSKFTLQGAGSTVYTVSSINLTTNTAVFSPACTAPSGGYLPQVDIYGQFAYNGEIYTLIDMYNDTGSQIDSTVSLNATAYVNGGETFKWLILHSGYYGHNTTLNSRGIYSFDISASIVR